MARELTLSLLILCISWKSATAISCYDCDSTIREDNVEMGTKNGCANVTTETQKGVFSVNSCMTTVYVNGGMATIRRTGGEKNETRDYCVHSGPSETICYCTGENCNSEGLTAGPYDCYDCSSSDYFDNGCGEIVNPVSKYVDIVRGCGGCSKTVFYDDDNTMRYQRECIKGRYVQAMNCNGTSTGGKCVCKGSLCNSAEKFKSTSASAAIILLTFLSALF